MLERMVIYRCFVFVFICVRGKVCWNGCFGLEGMEHLCWKRWSSVGVLCLSLSVLEVKSVGIGALGWKGWSICVGKDGHL